MTILDNELTVASGVEIDLGAKHPGPGEPIKCVAFGVSANVVVNSGDVAGTRVPATTVVCGAEPVVEFELQSNIGRYIDFTFADGSVHITLAGNQTAQ